MKRYLNWVLIGWMWMVLCACSTTSALSSVPEPLEVSYEVNVTVTPDATGYADGMARCHEGDSIVAGGCSVGAAFDERYRTIDTLPVWDDAEKEPVGWRCIGKSGAGDSVTSVVVTAVCVEGK